MNVVLPAADGGRGALEPIRDAAEVGVQLLAQGLLGKKGWRFFVEKTRWM